MRQEMKTMFSRRQLLAGAACGFAAGCAPRRGAPALIAQVSPPERAQAANWTASIDIYNDALTGYLDPAAKLETLGTGYQWSEGPTWDGARKRLYFTDVPQNTAYMWEADKGVRVFLERSGASSDALAGFREPGANGLLMASAGDLLICNHGKRAIEAMNLQTGRRTTLAKTYRGQRFNSPNDIVQARNGDLYFTDPPYGLEGLNSSPLKEMTANGVYHLRPDGGIRQVASDMTFPNGIALSPDEAYLYVSQSDPDAPLIRRIRLADGEVDPIWFDAKPFTQDGSGLPDGMVVSATGHVFATGPGGIYVITPEGEALGRIKLDRAAANCTFGEDGRSLFITAHDRLLRIRTRARGMPAS